MRSVFDLPWDAATLFFQTGVPEMDFPRSDWPANHRFVGPLRPHAPARRRRSHSQTSSTASPRRS